MSPGSASAPRAARGPADSRVSVASQPCTYHPPIAWSRVSNRPHRRRQSAVPTNVITGGTGQESRLISPKPSPRSAADIRSTTPSLRKIRRRCASTVWAESRGCRRSRRWSCRAPPRSAPRPRATKARGSVPSCRQQQLAVAQVHRLARPAQPRHHLRAPAAARRPRSMAKMPFRPFGPKTCSAEAVPHAGGAVAGEVRPLARAQVDEARELVEIHRADTVLDHVGEHRDAARRAARYCASSSSPKPSFSIRSSPASGAAGRRQVVVAEPDARRSRRRRPPSPPRRPPAAKAPRV